MNCVQEPQVPSDPFQHDHLPHVLVLRSPSVPAFFFPKSHMQAHFHLLDPLDSPEPVHTFLSRYASSVHALLCVSRTSISSEILSLLPSLKLIVASSAGIDHIDLQECRRRGIAITTAGQVFNEDVADLAVGLLIDVLRRVSASDNYVRAGLWAAKETYPLGVKLSGKRIGIVGLGNIGSEVAKRLAAFSCSIAYFARKEKPSIPYFYYSNVNELATDSDALIVCCSLTNETRYIINRAVMEALGKKGVVVNIGRGALIDEKEMVELLVRGKLGGAGLDVYENEPQVPQQLLAMDNVVLAPHAAVYTPESFAALAELIVGNLKAFFSNEPLLSPLKFV